MESECSRGSDGGAGWYGDVGSFEDRMPTPRPPRLSWLNPALWWSSRQEVRARLGFGDISDARRRAWVAPLTADDFTVAPSTGPGRFSFVVLCDTGEGDRSQYAVVPPLLALAHGEVPDTDPPAAFGVVAGDVVYPSGSADQYDDKFFRPYRDLGVPVFGVPGNHDWHDGLQGFMAHICGRTDPSSRTRLEVDEPIANRTQRSPYYRIRTPLLTVVCIDTGLRGRLDADQGEWLERVSAQDGPKLLLSGTPLIVDGEVDPVPIRRARGRFATVWDVVTHPDHRYVASIAGDTHNYQHYRPAEPDGIHHIVSGGGGAFMHGTHTIPLIGPRPGADIAEDRVRLYPLRRDSLAAFSQVLDKRLGGRGVLCLEPEEAAAALSARLGVAPVSSRGATGRPTRRAVRVDRLLSRFGGRWFQRFWSPFLDWDTPPFFKQFLRIDVTEGGLRIRCVAVDGSLRREREPCVEDDFTVALGAVRLPPPRPIPADQAPPACDDAHRSENRGRSPL